jgi:hypothetical protein
MTSPTFLTIQTNISSEDGGDNNFSNNMQKGIKIFLITTGILSLFMGLIVLDSLDLTLHTLDTSYSIYNNFLKTADCINKYNEKNGEYPLISELKQEEAPCGNKVELIANEDLIKNKKVLTEENFEPFPTDSYILSTWRGEWSEYYAFPSSRTSLRFDLEDYVSFWLPFSFLTYSFLCFYILLRKRFSFPRKRVESI